MDILSTWHRFLLFCVLKLEAIADTVKTKAKNTQKTQQNPSQWPDCKYLIQTHNLKRTHFYQDNTKQLATCYNRLHSAIDQQLLGNSDNVTDYTSLNKGICSGNLQFFCVVPLKKITTSTKCLI